MSRPSFHDKAGSVKYTNQSFVAVPYLAYHHNNVLHAIYILLCYDCTPQDSGKNDIVSGNYVQI